MEELEQMLFEIISYVGMARSNYIEAIQFAQQGKMEQAKAAVTEGKGNYTEGHKVHMDLLTQDVSGGIPVGSGTLLLIHAEDQLMSAETFGILAEEFITLCERLKEKGIIENHEAS